MSAATHRPPGRARARRRVVALYRLLLRTQVTVPRLLGIAALGALAILLGVFARQDDDPAQAAADIAGAYGLGILVPLAALWFGTSAIGDLVEDRLLVYIWLKPVPRWQLPAAADLATVTLVAPLTALPLAHRALVAGAGELALSALLAPRSRSPPMRACSSRPGCGSGAPCGGGWRSCCSGRTPPPTSRRASPASRSRAGRTRSLDGVPASTSRWTRAP